MRHSGPAESSVEDNSSDDEVLTLSLVNRKKHEIFAVQVNDDQDKQNMYQYRNKVMAVMELKGSPYPVIMQIDSGCTCDVIPEHYLPAGTVVKKTKQTYKRITREKCQL